VVVVAVVVVVVVVMVVAATAVTVVRRGYQAGARVAVAQEWMLLLVICG
jgi:hypothetical protein